MLRQNLNTFLRHGVFENPAALGRAVATLRDPERITRARVLPCQLMVAGESVDAAVPAAVREALDAALELAVANLPRVEGSVAVCPDVTRSMTGPVTGIRKGATSRVRHIDVAALVAAAMLRANPHALVLPFEHEVREVALDPTSTIRANARALAAIGGGGTNCSAPLAWLNARGLAPDLVVFVSDKQSWVGAARGRRVHGDAGRVGAPEAAQPSGPPRSHRHRPLRDDAGGGAGGRHEPRRLLGRGIRARRGLRPG
jgi:60 kDa SS-A/Ro ribonucleoprotein